MSKTQQLLELVLDWVNNGGGTSNAAVDRKQYSGSATNGISTYAVAYTVPFVKVFVNGYLIPPADYTATTGTSVTLASPLTEDDILDVEGITSSFNPSNAYTQPQADAKFVPRDLTTATERSTLSGAEYFPADFSGLKKIALSSIVTFFLSVTRRFEGYLGIAVDPLVPLHVRGVNAGAPDTTGTGVTGVVLRVHNSAVVNDFGTYSSGVCFIQPRLASNNATNFDLFLNPNGGVTRIGKAVAFAEEFNAGNSTAPTAINFSNGQKQKLTLTGSHTVSFTFPGVGNYQLKLVQNATGNFTPTWSGVSKYVGSASAPAINLAANSETIVSLYYDGATVYLAAGKVNAT